MYILILYMCAFVLLDAQTYLCGLYVTCFVVGTMNQFFFWINEKKEKELITCPLDGTILPGVTRDSILQIARKWNEFKVTERHFTMPEVVRALNEGRLLESFGVGTAAIISPVFLINYKGKDYKIPLDSQNPKENAGPLAKKLFKAITDIQYGKVPHPWSVTVPEK
ncbi:branched-chain amino acid aminotransferase [Reticulomyxa filosa]|uniref:Branched-chain amino acid aminotransferase n=1 Tax=Reticulomyxa filosa TaxID=46433 RepID=X6MXE9_RETFI|nr:branched-chain amino acid aminotransferase [Reticulomyxa filosa]|eukprot:ETO17755.1 branched-chain amino acid aminotransferase [Reticulomyxa filosa]